MCCALGTFPNLLESYYLYKINYEGHIRNQRDATLYALY